MFKRYYLSLRNIKPIDIAFFLTINIVCGIYVWKPFFKDVYDKRILNNPYDKIAAKKNESINEK
jgi:hypothetical protein